MSGPSARRALTARPAPVLEIGGTHVTAALVVVARGVVRVDSVRRRALAPRGSATELLGGVIAGGLELPVFAGEGLGVPVEGRVDLLRTARQPLEDVAPAHAALLGAAAFTKRAGRGAGSSEALPSDGLRSVPAT